MTDNDIIKALDNLHRKILATRFAEQVTESEIMGLVNAISLIDRQKAEIERLKYNLKAVLEERADHSEAIKEFAERLKANYSVFYAYKGGLIKSEIDNLVKEMTEDQK